MYNRKDKKKETPKFHNVIKYNHHTLAAAKKKKKKNYTQ